MVEGLLAEREVSKRAVVRIDTKGEEPGVTVYLSSRGSVLSVVGMKPHCSG